MVKDTIKLNSLNLEELSGIVSIYPWFACARIELCKRMSRLGDVSWDEDKYAGQALFVPDRKRIYLIMKDARKDKIEKPAPSKPAKQVYVIGGDFFSADDYAQARKEEDSIFSTFVNKAIEQNENPVLDNEECTEFYTEELAKIYMEQGYPQKAKQIYSKLSLLFPEKSAYFAGLIEKINK